MKDAEVREFLQDLYYLIEGKIPIGEALNIIKGQKKKNIVFHEKLIKYIEGGHSLAYSLEKAGLTDNYILKVIEMSEKGDFLEDALLDLSKLMDEKANLKSRIINSLIYPTILLFFAFITMVFTFSYVVPSIQDIYTVLGIEPRLLLRVLERFNIGYLFIGAFCILFLHYYINYRRGRLRKLLLIGPMVNNLHKFLLYKMLSGLLQGGVPLYQSLEIVAAFPRQFGEVPLKLVLQEVFMGKPLHLALSSTGFEQPIAINFIRIAEESGDITKGIVRTERYYKRNLDNMLLHFGKIFEPVVIAVVGITVVIVVLILLLPIYQLFQDM